MRKSRSVPEQQQTAPLDASVIDSAPVEPEVLPAIPAYEYESYLLIGELSDKLAESEAEVDRLKGQQSVEQVKAGLLAPYSNRVFWFVVGYCAVVGIMLALAGWGSATGFKLSDAILGIIAGSTAVSVIGLIGMVISGLFGVGKSKPPK